MLHLLKSKYSEEHLEYVLRINTVCESLAGNPCFLLTITNDVKKHDISLKHNRGKTAYREKSR
jgi:hypothetical protein